MSNEIAVQATNDEVIAFDVVAPIVENNVPVAAETVTSKPKEKVATATATAVAKAAAKPKVTKKAVAAKPAKQVVAETLAPAPKTPSKTVKKIPAATKEKLAEVPKAAKAAKVKKQAPKKPKLVRDSFTIPEADYALFATLKQRALGAGIEVKKSEMLRAAVATLAKLDDAELVKAFGLVERIKTGRPKK